MTNRIIKFRAWFKEEKEMREVAMLRWENGRMSRIAGYWKGTQDNGWTDYDPQEDRIVLMQWTGLLDKDGKEIYEGDIVDSISHDPRRMQVDFIEGGFCMNNNDSYPIDIAHFYPSVGTDLEVIGNIYESPDLITKTT